MINQKQQRFQDSVFHPFPARMASIVQMPTESLSRQSRVHGSIKTTRFGLKKSEGRRSSCNNFIPAVITHSKQKQNCGERVKNDKKTKSSLLSHILALAKGNYKIFCKQRQEDRINKDRSTNQSLNRMNQTIIKRQTQEQMYSSFLIDKKQICLVNSSPHQNSPFRNMKLKVVRKEKVDTTPNYVDYKYKKPNNKTVMNGKKTMLQKEEGKQNIVDAWQQIKQQVVHLPFEYKEPFEEEPSDQLYLTSQICKAQIQPKERLLTQQLVGKVHKHSKNKSETIDVQPQKKRCHTSSVDQKGKSVYSVKNMKEEKLSQEKDHVANNKASNYCLKAQLQNFQKMFTFFHYQKPVNRPKIYFPRKTLYSKRQNVRQCSTQNRKTLISKLSLKGNHLTVPHDQYIFQ